MCCILAINVDIHIAFLYLNYGILSLPNIRRKSSGESLSFGYDSRTNGDNFIN